MPSHALATKRALRGARSSNRNAHSCIPERASARSSVPERAVFHDENLAAHRTMDANQPALHSEISLYPPQAFTPERALVSARSSTRRASARSSFPERALFHAQNFAAHSTVDATLPTLHDETSLYPRKPSSCGARARARPSQSARSSMKSTLLHMAQLMRRCASIMELPDCGP